MYTSILWGFPSLLLLFTYIHTFVISKFTLFLTIFNCRSVYKGSNFSFYQMCMPLAAIGCYNANIFYQRLKNTSLTKSITFFFLSEEKQSDIRKMYQFIHSEVTILCVCSNVSHVRMAVVLYLFFIHILIFFMKNLLKYLKLVT